VWLLARKQAYYTSYIQVAKVLVMTETLSPAERLRRRYKPSPARELLADFRTELAAVTDPAEAQQLFDAAVELAGDVVSDGGELNRLTEALHRVAFPPDQSASTAGHRVQALDRHPELQQVFDAVEAAESDAEKGEIVAAAIASHRFDGDNDALIALMGADPTIDQRLDADEDPEPLRERDRAETDRILAEAAATVTPSESPAQAMLRQHLEAAETAAAEQETASVDA
jgi:hypothetical protein